MSSFDEYFSTLKTEEKAELERIRKIVKKLVPSVEEGTSYGMPAYKYKGKAFLSAMATKKFMSIYPFGGKIIKELKELQNYETTPGSIHFSLDKPLPETLLKEIIKLKLEEIDAKLKK